MDIELVEYVQQLRDGILEAYSGIIVGLKHTEKATLLLPHIPPILELVQRALADSERQDSTVKLAVGIIGDLADAFPNGEIKQYLLVEWIAAELRAKHRGASEVKRTVRWAREVRLPLTSSFAVTNKCLHRSSSAPQRRTPPLLHRLLSIFRSDSFSLTQ